MKKENFKALLTDLYLIYNESHLKNVDNLVEKYSGGLEHDSVRNILIKYNHKGSKFYDNSKDSMEFVHSIIKDYDDGNRTLNGFKLTEIKKVEPEQIKLAKQEDVEKTIKTLKEEFEKTNIDTLRNKEKQLEELESNINKKIEEIKKSLEDQLLIDIIIVWTNSELEDIELTYKSREILSRAGKGARVIVKDNNGKMIGVEIIDILVDLSALDENPIIEIMIEKK